VYQTHNVQMFIYNLNHWRLYLSAYPVSAIRAISTVAVFTCIPQITSFSIDFAFPSRKNWYGSIMWLYRSKWFCNNVCYTMSTINIHYTTEFHNRQLQICDHYYFQFNHVLSRTRSAVSESHTVTQQSLWHAALSCGQWTAWLRYRIAGARCSCTGALAQNNAHA